MPSLILRKYRSIDRVELTIENIESLSVQELKKNVSMKMGVPLHELKLVYGGRVLKGDKKVVDYEIVAGCTIYVMTFTSKKSVDGGAKGRKKGGLMSNKRVLSMIGRVLSNPVVLQEMLEGTPMAGNASIQHIMTNPQLLANLTDPNNIQEYIRDNPDVGRMMEQMIQQSVGSGSDSAGEQSEEQMIDMFESHLEEEMAQLDREGQGEVPRAQAQDQMFEHSQALHAHHQQQRYHLTSSSGAAGPSSLPSNTPAITQDQLLSALASALGPSSSQTSHTSPLSSMDFSQSSGPSSLLSEQLNSLPSNPPPPPYSASLRQPLGGIPNSSDSGGGGGDMRPGPINAATLQQALSDVARATTSTPRTQGGNERREGRRYQEQLEQLHLMGITDDTACRQALSATGGDLQAALEILYSK